MTIDSRADQPTPSAIRTTVSDNRGDRRLLTGEIREMSVK
jgi:hypothetical protein